MGEVKQINIKNRTYYFYNDMINIKDYELNLLKIDRKSYKDIGIYNIGYIAIKAIDDCENIYSVNPLYLLVNHENGYIEAKNEINTWPLTLQMKINEAVSSGKFDYEKDYMKIKFNSDNNLPLNKPPKFHSMTITIRSVFEEDGKIYPQVFLDDNLYVLNV